MHSLVPLAVPEAQAAGMDLPVMMLMVYLVAQVLHRTIEVTQTEIMLHLSQHLEHFPTIIMVQVVVVQAGLLGIIEGLLVEAL